MSALSAVINAASAIQSPLANRDELQVRTSQPAETSATTATSAATSAATDAIDTVDQGDGSDPTGQLELTIDNLLEAWGTDDPTYDLNGDGNVDIDDLFALLDKMAQELHGGENDDIEPLSPPDEPAPLGPIEGSDQPPAGDTPSTSPPSGADETIQTPSTGDNILVQENPEGSESGQDNDNDNGTGLLTIDNLLDAWGTDDPGYDLNGDGTVDIDDLFALLAQMAENNDPTKEPPSPLGPSLGGTFAQAEQTGTLTLANTLIEKLTQVGYEDHPPSNLRSIVDALGLDSQQQSELTQTLSEFYSQGLGINYKA